MMGNMIDGGQWKVLAVDSQITAIHAALLCPTDNIVYFGGTEFNYGNYISIPKQIDHTRLFDPGQSSFINPGSPTNDLFCSGHAFLPDGRLLVAGGTEQWFLPDADPNPHHSHFTGLRDTWIFDVRKGAGQWWVKTGDMNLSATQPGGDTGGRWYPTLVTLPSGEILAMCGHPAIEDVRHNNTTPEIFDPQTGKWRYIPGSVDSKRPFALGLDEEHDYLIFYPRLHVLTNGNVLCVNLLYSISYGPASAGWKGTPSPNHQYDEASIVFDPKTGQIQGTVTGITKLDQFYNEIDRGAQHTTSVLLPLLPEESYRERIMLCGGQNPLVADVTALPSQWQPTAPRSLPGRPVRHHVNAVILPTGDIFVCGGLNDPANDNSGPKQAEFYQPSVPSWNQAESWQAPPNDAPEKVPRGYHSVALLMPDGRVWTAGSSKNGASPSGPPYKDTGELRMEVYEPWYISRPRPQIASLSVPAFVQYDKEFVIEFNHNSPIQRVAYVRTGSCTHAFNPDQRYVGLVFKPVAGQPNKLAITPPPNGNIAPPGYYLLFIVDDRGVPSEGHCSCLVHEPR
ncbi:MAG: galactose oxidase-like domain-containing protein [Aggregatilineales bacterium]